ncbi:beta-ketoacyl synthase N-terminal-like domain-containing protein, partial [Campylobacter jejuni]|uniref:beta-ketoacyl synthase N-terminal-like domain-containing protein n=1 Tax=Campylobacter jejuni TaxID=197 RepID=UPI0025A0E308
MEIKPPNIFTSAEGMKKGEILRGPRSEQIMEFFSMLGKEVKKIDRFIQLGIKAAREAMQDAGFSEELDKEEFGIVSAA